MQRIRRGACLVVALVLSLSACASVDREPTKLDDPPAEAGESTQQAAPSDTDATRSSATSSAISVDVPLLSEKGYTGTLSIRSGVPEIELGDPGKVRAGPLPLTSVTVSNETDGGRPALLEGRYGVLGIMIFAAWRVPSGTDCSGCSYILARGLARYGEVSADSVTLSVGAPAAFTLYAIPTAFGDEGGNSPVYAGSAQFPESAQGDLAAILAEPPTSVYVIPGANGGLSFGSPEGDSLVSNPCVLQPDWGAETPVYAAVDGRSGEVLRWPASHARPGQPCHTEEGRQP